MTMNSFWALDTNDVWHLYNGALAECGYETNGAMVDGPRPVIPDDDESLCEVCRGSVLKVEVRECEDCKYTTECTEVVFARHGQAPADALKKSRRFMANPL